MDNSLDQVTSQVVVLPTGVIVLGGVLLLALGLALIVAGVRTWVRWRRLTRDYGAGDLTSTAKGRDQDPGSKAA